MRLTIFTWLDHEFIRLYAEGEPGAAVPAATRAVLGRIASQLEAHGLSLDDTMRTRLFARDRASRDAGSAARREVFSGRARSASSGLVAPAVLDAGGAVALEIVLLRPRQAAAEKTLVEYDPPRTPLRYLVYDSLLFTSGETQPGATLAEQVAATLAIHAESLSRAGLSWDDAVLISCFLQRSYRVDALRQALQQAAPVGGVPFACELVEGFAGEGRLVEIEVTALVG
jgi:enamine deaminase RidA (YjgF/YER057c/UK114 family)